MNPGNNNEMEAASLKNIEQETAHKVVDPGGITVEKFNNIEHELDQEKKKIENERKIQETKEGILAKFSAKFKEYFGGGNKQDFMDDMSKKMNAWISQGAVPKPTSEEMEVIMKDAEKDHFSGKIGIKEKKLAYRTSDEIKWATSGHSFGSGE